MADRPHVTQAVICACVLVTALCAIAGVCDTGPAGVLAAGTEWEHPYYVIDSGEPGPTVLLTAGMHGNEPAGYRAAEQIRHWPIVAGKLVVVPHVNTAGLRENTRYLPAFADDEELRNANRNFPKTDGPDVAVTPPCEALWALAKELEPDWVVDLHEGFDFHISNPKSVGASVIYWHDDDIEELVDPILAAVNETIDDEDRKIDRLDGGHVDGGLLRAAGQRLGAKRISFETCFKGQPLSTRTRQQRIMVSELLQGIGLMDRDCRDVMSPGPGGGTRQIALYDAGGTGAGGVRGLTRLIDDAEAYAVHHLGPADATPEVLAQFDIVLFPGGSGSKQARAIGEEGRRAVKDFVKSGGGYLGICAGAYLASAYYDWSLDILDTNCLTGPVPGVEDAQMWYRGGSGVVDMDLTPDGQAFFGDKVEVSVEVRYHNGPILSPAADEAIPDYEVLALFRSEVAKHEAQEGTMVDTPAIISGRFGKGRAIAISPHPESTPGLQPVVIRCLDWLMER